jgi:hypothetical protein
LPEDVINTVPDEVIARIALPPPVSVVEMSPRALIVMSLPVEALMPIAEEPATVTLPKDVMLIGA